MPTLSDVDKMTVEYTAASSEPKLSFTVVANTVAYQIEAHCSKASIPIVSHARVFQKVKKLHYRYYALRKSYSREKDTAGKQTKYNYFIEQSSNTLFEISSCKCKMTLHCSCEKSFDKGICPSPIIVNCSRPKDRKISPLETKFLYAQRHLRQGKIGTVDAKESQKLTLRLQRKARQLNHISSPEPSSISIDPETEIICEIDSYENDHDFQFQCPRSSKSDCLKSSQMRLSLSATALTSDRFCVSDRATAAIASSVLKDLGLITDSNTSLETGTVCNLR